MYRLASTLRLAVDDLLNPGVRLRDLADLRAAAGLDRATAAAALGLPTLPIAPESRKVAGGRKAGRGRPQKDRADLRDPIDEPAGVRTSSDSADRSYAAIADPLLQLTRHLLLRLRRSMRSDNSRPSDANYDVAAHA